jgi:hypothetical protein
MKPLISTGKRNQRTCLLVYDAWREVAVNEECRVGQSRSESFTVTGEGTWHQATASLYREWAACVKEGLYSSSMEEAHSSLEAAKEKS